MKIQLVDIGVAAAFDQAQADQGLYSVAVAAAEDLGERSFQVGLRTVGACSVRVEGRPVLGPVE